MSHSSRRFSGSSYAQNFEDVYIARAFDDVADGFYIDIGAYHPEYDSVTKLFYDHGWSGINVEPGPTFDLFVADRPRDININRPIAGQARDVVYHFHPQAPGTSGLLEDLPRELSSMVEHRQATTMRSITLEALVADHAPDRHIHFLKLDCEGFEAEIIASTNWRAFRPELLVVEATRPNTNDRIDGQWRDILLQAGYLEHFFDGINVYYLREESAHRAHAFLWPVNALDHLFKPDYGARAVIERLVQERDAASNLFSTAQACLEEERQQRAQIEHLLQESGHQRADADARHQHERDTLQRQLQEAYNQIAAADSAIRHAAHLADATPTNETKANPSQAPLDLRVQAFVDAVSATQNALNTALDDADVALAIAHERLADVETQLSAANKQIVALTALDADNKTKLANEQERVAALEAKRDHLETAVVHWQDVAETLGNTLEQQKRRTADLEMETAALERAVAELTLSDAQKANALEQAAQQIAKLDKKIADMAVDALHLRTRSRSAEGEIADLSLRLRGSVEAYDVLAQSHTEKVLEGLRLQSALQAQMAERERFLATLDWPAAPKALKFGLVLARRLRAAGNALARRRFLR